ncbi:MAG: pyridoxal phosphate-dependent aminotransferase [Alphaproteobacteria bacterium]|nr:pyridoxal phosphate-dependent aminotransferase [Alphaproteobacteria bacterium]
MSVRHPPRLRPEIETLGLSKIREVANAAFGQDDILRFWFGESDRETPLPIRQAAIEALQSGRVFYTHNSGNPDLRQTIATYLSGLHGRPIASASISVTSSGVNALMLAMQAILSPGDKVVAVVPVWPNLTEIPHILGAQVIRVAVEPSSEGWRLDLDRLLAAITPDVRLLLLNSPGNPTGWTMKTGDRAAILEHCRRLGVWIIADDVYERLIFDPSRRSAPSFLEISDPDDRVIGVNSFSKAWLMTGWRLGWMAAPPGLEIDLGKLIEYNTSCAPDFVQAAGLVAIRDGEADVLALRGDLQETRDLMLERLRAMPGVSAIPPEGGMYVFFRIAGQDNSLDLAKRLIREAGLGLAPGAAFGPEGEGWLRWCIATAPARLEQGLSRLETWLARSR